MPDFAHLHLHTDYSLMDGMIRLPDLFPRVLELGMGAVATTDHGTMAGVVDFYHRARSHGVKPIIGCEVYVAPGDRMDRTDHRAFHLVLLARSEIGYRKLCRLCSLGFLEGFYYNPRIDKPLLRAHASGLIGMSACLHGEIAKTLLDQGTTAAEVVALEYKDIFAPGDFYLELVASDLPEQKTVNDELQRIGARLGIPVVATGDCHYLQPADARAHDVLSCIRTGKTIRDSELTRQPVDACLKSPAEMAAAFADAPEAIENTVAIADRCNLELPFRKPVAPHFEIPSGQTSHGLLEELVWSGLDQRLTDARGRRQERNLEAYRDRCRHELELIRSRGFADYFLIVWDYVRWARGQGIRVGPGRGAAPSSMVAFALQITDVDPIECGLIFERFLNPERACFPHIDIDICSDRRDEVVRYLETRYGRDRLARIAAFHKLTPRGIARGIEAGGDLRPDIVAALAGLRSHVGVDTAGVVITDDPLIDQVPCFRGRSGELVTQYDARDLERLGFIKLDIFPLDELSIIDSSLRLINERRRTAGLAPLTLEDIPADDAEVFRMLSQGKTTGVFGLDTESSIEILSDLGPDCIEDIFAVLALDRTETGMVADFIDRKHGRKPVEYPHSSLEPILAVTHGLIVYQEQMMEIAHVLAGYSFGEADLLRRTLGKKQTERIAKEKERFLTGSTGRGVSGEAADQVFELLRCYAGLTFMRSHVVACGLLTYQTAYLECHYPDEFSRVVVQRRQ